ncbi:MAG: DUF3006 domain-containing protein [Tissierellaceae bacterium]|nr:DUF3006 domain-containing protein [Tissierellia bacterium]
MRIIIDRFEGDFAVVELEDKSFVDMPLKLIPEGAKEGDILEIEINREETEKLHEERKNKWLGLWD